MTGLFRAPRTGDYQFYLVSDDHSKVWLSTDATAANKAEIINFTSYSSYRGHMLFYDSNKSDMVTLQAGNFYYFEIQHAQGGGADHFSIGV